MEELTEFNIEKTTAEILILKDQTAQNIIEIGKRLINAKENLPHGEFIKWLEKKIDFSRYTANRFMKIATEFSNVSAVQHLGSRKLFALAGLDEEERQELIQKNNLEDMTTRQLEEVIKEKKEIKKQLAEGQEYIEELQGKIQERERQISKLKDDMKNIQIPEKEIIEKEVIKEVVPESIKSQVECLEKEKAELFQKYEEAKSTIVSMNNMKKCEIGQKYYDYGFDELSLEIADFLRKTSKYTYMDQEYSELNSNKKTLIKNGIKKIENWLIDMKKAMNESLMIGNNIYVEGGNEDE